MKQLLTPSDINRYLNFGYIPAFSKLSLHIDLGLLENYKCSIQSDFDLLSDQLFELLCSIIREYFEHHSAKKFILPLSAGLDSRILLVACLNLISDKSKLETVTVGLKNSTDQKIAKQLSEFYNITHTAIDLDKVPVSRAAILSVARASDKPLRYFDLFAISQISSVSKDEGIFITGMIGDSLSGKKLSRDIYDDEIAVDKFIASQSYTKISLERNLREELYEHVNNRAVPFIDPYDWLDLSIRQNSFIKPTFDSFGTNNFNPFADARWVNFWLAVPRNYRLDQKLYKYFAAKHFPEIFQIPLADGNYPASDKVKLIDKTYRRICSRIPMLSKYYGKSINYFDYKRHYTRKSTLYKVIESSRTTLMTNLGVEKQISDEIFKFIERPVSDYLDINLRLALGSLGIFSDI